MQLCPLTLRVLGAPVLEELYTLARVKADVGVDYALSHLKLAVTGLCVVLLLLGAMRADAGGLVVWLLYAATLSAQALALRLAPDAYRAHRAALILGLKCLCAACITAFVPLFVLAPTHTWAGVAKLLLLGGGLVMFNCTGLCMPVPWLRHVALSLGCVAAYDALLLPAVVDTLLCTPASVQLTGRLFRLLNAGIDQAGGLPLYASASDPRLPEPRAQAYVLLLWLQAMCGLLLPGTAVYLRERRSRAAFLKEHSALAPPPARLAGAAGAAGSSSNAPAQQLQQQPERLPQLHSGSCSPALHVVAFLVLSGFVAWKLLLLSAPGLAGALDAGLPCARLGVARLLGPRTLASCLAP